MHFPRMTSVLLRYARQQLQVSGIPAHFGCYLPTPEDLSIAPNVGVTKGRSAQIKGAQEWSAVMTRRRATARVPWIKCITMILFALGPTHVLATEARQKINGTLVQVIDGDTFILRKLDGYSIRVRIWGINAPEKNRPGGMRAANVLYGLIADEGRQLRCRYRDFDRYGRLVAQCETGHETDLGSHLVGQGVARDCPRFSNGHYAQFETSESASLPHVAFCHVH
jgi:micrococcal nuclease